MIECKGVADLLRAWAMLYPRLRNNADLLLLGEDFQTAGRYRTRMEALARDLNCGARFLGFRQDVSDWLLASDLAVVPSHIEALGNATLEAMAHALPVVACAVGGVPEMVVAEQTGLLVPPKQPALLAAALSRLIGDEKRRRRFGEAGRRRCEERFNLAAHVRGVLDAYRQVQSGAGAAIPA
jgi:glycosyltransferase involved in cell wall biosynthesis